MNIVTELRDKITDPTNKMLFAFLAERKDIKPITIDKILSGTRHKITRTDVVAFTKGLDKLNLCNFVTGRRNFPSRIMFYYTPASIGKVALGDSDKLVRMSQLDQADIVEETVHEAITPSTDDVAISSEEPLNFQVQTSALGTLFVLPTTATKADTDQLVTYIQQMAAKRFS